MADGINIEGGLNDTDLTSDFLDGSIQGLLLDFAVTLQNDLVESARKNKHFTAGNKLMKDLTVTPVLTETDDTIIYALELPHYATFLDQGVNGAGAPSDFYDKETPKVTGSPFSYTKSSKFPVKPMTEYAMLKDALGISNYKDAKRFGFLAARKKVYFGQKPSYWFSDVVTDGRIEELEEELGKKLAFVMIERFTDNKIKRV